MKLIAWIVLLDMSLSASALAQKDCMDQFNNALQKVQSIRQSQRNNGFEMICQIYVTPERGNMQKERMEISVFGSKYLYKGSNFSIYQDDRTMVVIRNEERTVFLTRPMPIQLRQNRFEELVKVQDSLLRYMTLKDCSKEFGTVDSRSGYLKMVFEPGKEIEGAGLKAVTYWLAPATQETRRIAIEYTDDAGYGVKRYELIVEKMDVLSTAIPFQGDALAMVMMNGVLLNQYRQYKLIDNRD